MSNAVSFFLKALLYYRRSRLPKAERSKIAMAKWNRLQPILNSIPCYRDRRTNHSGVMAFPPFDKMAYHFWNFSQRLAGPSKEFAERIQQVLKQHAEHCKSNTTPIRPFQFQDKSYLGYTTSGSSGRTIALVKSTSYLEELVALQVGRGSSEPKTLLNAWRKWRKPLRWAVLLRGPGAFPGISLLSNQPPVARAFLNQTVWDIASLPWETVRRQVIDFQPNIITTYPSTLVRLSQEEWPLHELHLAVAMSEPFTSPMKQTVQQQFPGAVITDHYATGECPILTTACPAGRGAHVNDDVASCTPLNKDGVPCRTGEVSSQVLITDLINDVQPFVNYLIEDQIVMDHNDDDKPCACGSRMPLIVGVEGRNNDKIKLPSGFVIDNVMLRGLVTRFPSIIDYQLIYDDSSPPRMCLNLVLEDRDQAAESGTSCTIAQALSDMTPEKVYCRSQIVPTLPVNQKTGKSQRFVFSRN